MWIKLDKSWNGRPKGTIMEVDNKHQKYIIDHKIGTKTVEPKPEKKVKKPNYETKAKDNDTSKDS